MKWILPILLYSSFSLSNPLPEFMFNNGWMGSDLAYSIPISNNKDLWLFGDTYIGPPGAQNRDGVGRVTNSIGVSFINKSGKFEINYYWRNMHTDHPESIFPHIKESEGYLYWPKDAILVNGKLYVALVEILVYDFNSPMGFKEVGTSLAIVENPNDLPNQWHYVYKNFSPHEEVFPGTRFIVEGKYLYWFSTYVQKRNDNQLKRERWKKMPILLQRVALDKLDNITTHQKYYAKSGGWKKGFNLEDAAYVMDHGATEMTVHFNSTLKLWIAVYGEYSIRSDKVVIRTANKLKGPWSKKPIEIFRYPEMNPESKRYFEGGFGYAPKFHPQFSNPDKPNEIVMTYVVNNLEEWRLIDRLDTYVPQVVRVTLPLKAKK